MYLYMTIWSVYDRTMYTYMYVYVCVFLMYVDFVLSICMYMFVYMYMYVYVKSPTPPVVGVVVVVLCKCICVLSNYICVLKNILCVLWKSISPNRFTCGNLSYKKDRLDTLVGALGLVGRGFGPAGRAGLGWAWGLAMLEFGRAGRAGWVGRVGPGGPLAGAWCWACWVHACWGRPRPVVPPSPTRPPLPVWRAGWVGRGVWPCWRWLLGVLGVVGALAGLGVGFGRAGRAGLGWAWARWLGWVWCSK